MATAYDEFFNKIQDNFGIMSKVTHYTVGFGEETAKFEHSKFQYF